MHIITESKKTFGTAHMKLYDIAATFITQIP